MFLYIFSNKQDSENKIYFSVIAKDDTDCIDTFANVVHMYGCNFVLCINPSKLSDTSYILQLDLKIKVDCNLEYSRVINFSHGRY